MKASKRLIGLTLALFFTNSVLACGNAKKKDCPLVQETTAYFDHKESVVSGAEIGKVYETFMENILALEKTGNFKNFKIINQIADVLPNYDNSAITSFTLRVTIKFDLNYEAISTLHKRFKKSTINISTYDIKKCP